MNENIIKIKNVKISAESFGIPGDPAVLLIMGATASMLHWDEEFCRRIAGTGKFVIRYDNRDTGQSTSYPAGTRNYTITDMADDAIGVLDFYKVTKAHLVGMALGGMISQIVAVRNPERVISLTIISSSIWDERPDLPGTNNGVIVYQSRAAGLSWSNENMVIEFLAGGMELLNGSAHKFNKKRATELAGAEYRRALSIQSIYNHALIAGGEEFYGRSADIDKPVLIIHGTEDIVLPFPHAAALHTAIKKSVLVTLKGSGHEIHEDEWDSIINAMKMYCFGG